MINEMIIKKHKGLGSPYELLIRKFILEDGLLMPRHKSFGYFKTKEEAIKFFKIHECESFLLFKDVFRYVLEMKHKCTSDYIRDLNFGFKKLRILHNIDVNNITLEMLETPLNKQTSKLNRKKAKQVVSLVYKLLVNSKILPIDLSKRIRLKRINKRYSKYNIFTDDELLLISDDSNKAVDIINFIINTGISIYNTLDIKTCDIDLDNRFIFIFGRAIIRTISLNDKAYNIVLKYYDANNGYLFNNHLGRRLQYHDFRRYYFNKLMSKYYLAHKPLDCYHTYLVLNGEKKEMIRKRKPNGYGTIKEYNDGRKKKYAVLVYGYKDGKPHQFVKGFYQYKYEAEKARSELFKNKELIDKSKYAYTFEDVYYKFLKDKMNRGISKNPEDTYRPAFRAVAFMHNIRFSKITKEDLYDALEKSGKNRPMLKVIINLFHGMYKYALSEDIVYKDVSGNIVIGKHSPLNKNPNRIIRTPFSKEEIQIIFNDNINTEMRDIVKVLLYSGMRINELLTLTKDSISLINTSIIIKEEYSKTDCSNREIPIHPEIFNIILNKYNKCINDNETLFKNIKGEPFKYRNFMDSYWKPYMRIFNMKHNPH
ncbi:MAG: tyrosine-type recombinase/integrase, partial [Acholeplasmatales bacterium]|nr:tyrosine-type recombinase/integrase [Acholeplasmatales bacterium]